MADTSFLERWSAWLAGMLRRCPAPGVERPTRPTSLAYAARGNPNGVCRGRVPGRKDEEKRAHPGEKLDPRAGKRHPRAPVNWCAIGALELSASGLSRVWREGAPRDAVLHP